MEPRRKPHQQDQGEIRREGPELEEQDWETIETGVPEPESGQARPDIEPSGEAPGEDDDNAYQNSDEALPDDREEAAIARDPTKEGSRFDEV